MTKEKAQDKDKIRRQDIWKRQKRYDQGKDKTSTRCDQGKDKGNTKRIQGEENTKAEAKRRQIEVQEMTRHDKGNGKIRWESER